ncbi:MAG: cupin domain-containing protein [Burkholderiales bacterium]
MIDALHKVTPGRSLSADGPWIPEGPGKWSRPLRFLKDGRGWVELMRLEPGVKLGLHRHTGEVHAFNLEGQRRLCTGEIVGPGDYVHEPAGNVDWWEAVGDEPLIVMVVVMGSVEYVRHDGAVIRRVTTADRIGDYQRYCSDAGIEPQDLLEH